MTFEYKKQIRAAFDLKAGDKMEVAGIVCTVTKVVDLVDSSNNRVRITLSYSIPESSDLGEAILFLQRGTAVEILK
jgi:hypothetical protein